MTVVATLVDDDVSAYSGKRRTGYTELVDLITERQVDVVLAWAADRLHRAPAELERFIDLVNDAGVDVRTVQGGDVDLETASGRMMARMMGTVARYESEHRGARTQAAHEQIAQQGRWKGGKRPYGYTTTTERGMLVIVDDEADVIREAVARVLAGERVGSVASDLNRRGITGATGAPWTSTSLRGVISNGTIAGRRIYKGDDIGPAVWEPIVDPATATQLAATLGRGVKRGAAPRVALLSGSRLTCEACGGPMSSCRRSNNSRGYRCTTDFTNVAAEPLEALITESLLLRLDAAPIPRTHRTGKDKAGPSIEQLEADLAALADDHGAGRISRAEWMAARAPMTQRLDDARSALTDVVSRAALTGLTDRGAVRAAWPSLSLARRQAILDVLIESVTVKRTGPTGRGLNPERIDIRWRA